MDALRATAQTRRPARRSPNRRPARRFPNWRPTAHVWRWPFPWLMVAVAALAACDRSPTAPELAALESPAPANALAGADGAAGAAGAAQLQGALSPCQQLLPPIADPITRTEYPFALGLYYNTGAASEGDGLIYLPANNASIVPASGRFPLVVLLHATGYQYEEYKEVQKHLARNGFAVASLDWNPFQGDQSDEVMLDHLDYLFQSWTWRNRLANNIALVGHSRGGKFVLMNADEVAAAGYDVNAIACLAPAPQSLADVNVPAVCDRLLVMMCAGDEDPAANGTTTEVGGLYDGVRYSGFLTYDAGGPWANEWNTDNVQPSYIKSMVYASGGGHWAFESTGTHAPGFVAPATVQGYRDFTEGYLNAYLRWTLRGQNENSIFFQGRLRPAALLASIALMVQYSGNPRVVVENAHGAALGTNTAGGANIFEDLVAVQKGLAVQLDDSSPHLSRVLDLTWAARDTRTIPRARLLIPPAGPRWNLRDVSGAKFLSFRVGQIHGSGYNPVGQDQGFYVRLKSAGGALSPAVPVGGVPYPFQAAIPPQRSPMRTVLIPVCAFEGIALGAVSEVIFEFTDPAHPTGRVHLDSVEFLGAAVADAPEPIDDVVAG